MSDSFSAAGEAAAAFLNGTTSSEPAATETPVATTPETPAAATPAAEATPAPAQTFKVKVGGAEQEVALDDPLRHVPRIHRCLPKTT